MRINVLAGLCSVLVTGLGQIIKGKSDKGVALLLLYYFALPAVIYVSLLLSGSLFPYLLGFSIIFGIIVWLYNIWDAVVN